MPEPIREAKIVRPASPIEYRSGKADYKDGGPPARFALYLAGLAIGLSLNAVGTFVLMVASGHNFVLLVSAHFVGFVFELLYWYRVAKLPQRRTILFLRGTLLGVMLVTFAVIFLAIFL